MKLFATVSNSVIDVLFKKKKSFVFFCFLILVSCKHTYPYIYFIYFHSRQEEYAYICNRNQLSETDHLFSFP